MRRGNFPTAFMVADTAGGKAVSRRQTWAWTTLRTPGGLAVGVRELRCRRCGTGDAVGHPSEAADLGWERSTLTNKN